MPLHVVARTIKGLELISYDEKTGAGELWYDEGVLSEESIVKKLEERKYKVVK